MKRIFLACGVLATLLTAAGGAWAQDAAPKARLIPMAVFDAGQPQTGIYKLYDPADGVICYVLTPEVATRRKTEAGWAYEGNSVGSISCVKATAPAPAQAAIGQEAVAPSGLARPAAPKAAAKR